MSGDVQPRKRKEKRRKKEDSEEIPSNFSNDEQLHVHKDASTGGNICAKILFFLLSFVLLVTIGLVVFEYRGSADDEALVPVSKWASTFDGWLETPVKHDEHADVTESGEQEHGESGEHENESAEGEEHLSEEAASKEDEEEEEETKESEEEETKSEEEETKSAEEEEDEESDKSEDEGSEEVDEESDKSEDEGSEEVDENEVEEIEDGEDDEDEEQEEESEEDMYEHRKSEEDVEGEEDGTEEEEDEEEDAESGREEPDDDDDDDEERKVPTYGRESDEIDDLLSKIPGITESDEDEEGDNLGRSDEIIDKLQKIPGVQEKKIKAISEEEDDQPRRKQEKEVSGATQPVEGTSTVKVGQKPHEQHKNQDQDKSEAKAHQSAVKQKDVTEKPIVAKHDKPKAIHPQEELASKSSHQAHSIEHPTVKNDAFPSGPGEAARSQKAEDLSASKVTPSKKQKVNIEATKGGSTEAIPRKKQKDVAGPTLKSEQIPEGHSKPIVSGGKNVKDKDVSSDGVHSPPKTSQIGDKIEHSPKGGKSSTIQKAPEQSSPTKLDTNDIVSVSKSPRIDKSDEEHTKPIKSKDTQGTKSVHSASDKNMKIDTSDVHTTADNGIKRSDLKGDIHAKLDTARKSASVDKAIKSASNGKGKENIRVEPGVKETESLNSQTKQAKGSHSTDEMKLAGKKVGNLHKNEGHPSNREMKNVEKLAPKLGHHAETVHHVDVTDSSATKTHEDPKKMKVEIKKQKAGASSRAQVSDEVNSEVPVKGSTDKVRKVSTDDSTKTRTSEKSDDVNAARKKISVDNTPPEVKHSSKTRDTKATPETTLKHSVRKDDSSKTQGGKPNVQSAASGKYTQEKELRPTSASETHTGHQENSGNNKPLNPNIKKPSHGQKVSPQRIESEVIQSKSEGSSREKAVPSRPNSNSETVGGEIKSSKTTQDKTVVEKEVVEDEPEPSGVPKTRKLQREEDDESGSEKEVPVTKSKIPKNMGGQNAQVYSKADITNEDDWHIIQDLDRADDDAEENPEVAIHRYDTLLKSHPNSPRAWYGKATALDQLAAKKKSNLILDQAIEAYRKVISGLTNVPDKLFSLAAERCIDRMRFRGIHARAVPIHKLLIARFPGDPAYQNQLAVTHLMVNRSPEAKQVLENVLQKWPKNGFAQVHYGFILKTGNYNMTEAVRYLQEGIATKEPGTIDGRFFFQLGDALMRLGRRKEAMEVNELGVREGLFLSKYQRSLYNVDRLRAQPWWTPEETTYAPYIRKLQENWEQIKDEGVKALYDKNRNLFRDEAENLKDSGKWKQLELFARGRKVPANCAKVPVTCKLIEEFPAARDCRRGQVKFSVMDPGTHVWPHCGPTNCRLRAHLGLVVPKNTFIRVAEETRTWEEGKLFIFDDSFEHEVWHNGTATRLVLIVDVWHPELTMEEKRTLPAI